MTEKIEVTIQNLTLYNPKVKAKSFVVHGVDCLNGEGESMDVRCPLESNHYQETVIRNITFPFSTMSFANLTGSANLFFPLQSITVSKAAIMSRFDLGITASGLKQWSIGTSGVTVSNFQSNKISEDSYLTQFTPEESCIRLQYNDTVYDIEMDYRAKVLLQIYNQSIALEGEVLTNKTKLVIPGTTFTTDNDKVSYEEMGKIVLRSISPNVTSIVPIQCTNIDYSPPSPPTVPLLAVNRFAVQRLKNQADIVTTLGLDAQTWQDIASFKSVDIYKALVTDTLADAPGFDPVDIFKYVAGDNSADNCLDQRIYIPIFFPLPFIPFFFFIIIPIWIDSQYITASVKVSAELARLYTQNVLDKANTIREIKNNINAGNIIKVSSKVVAVTKVVASGNANDELNELLGRIGTLTKELADSIVQFDELKATAENGQKIVEQISNLFSSFQEIANLLNDQKKFSVEIGIELSALLFQRVLQIVEVFKEIVKFTNELQDNIITRLVKKLINSVVDFSESIYNETLILRDKLLNIQNNPQRGLDLSKEISNIPVEFRFVLQFLQDFVAGKDPIENLPSEYKEIAQVFTGLFSDNQTSLDSIPDEYKEIIQIFTSLLSDGSELPGLSSEATEIFNSFADFIKNDPTIQSILGTSENLIQEISNILTQITDLFDTKLLITLINTLKVLFDFIQNTKLVNKLALVLQLTDTTQLQQNLVNHLLEELGAKRLAQSLDKKAAEVRKSDVEKFLEEKALEGGQAVDEYVGEGIKFLKLKEAEQEAFKILNQATSLVQQGINAFENNLVAELEATKRNVISNTIKHFLNSEIYEITAFGHFDPNKPEDIQLVVNNIDGTKIYSQSGILLWEDKEFCNKPFIETQRKDTNGCNVVRRGDDSFIGILENLGIETRSYGCGKNDWKCGELRFWHSIFRYRVSFDFMLNHNLEYGGIRVGNFDNNVVESLWCHYPSNTKGYNANFSNIIKYSPLLFNKTLELDIEAWCSTGIVKIGDFNGDKKDDALCILGHYHDSQQKFFLLYSTGGSFVPAQNTDGYIGNFDGWAQSDSIVLGDFDGDGIQDLLKIESFNKISILYGHKTDFFVSKDFYTNEWRKTIPQSKIDVCSLSQGIRLMSADINNDKKDDVVCVSRSETYYEVIYSITIPLPNDIGVGNIPLGDGLGTVNPNGGFFDPSTFDSVVGFLSKARTTPKLATTIIISDVILDGPSSNNLIGTYKSSSFKLLDSRYNNPKQKLVYKDNEMQNTKVVEQVSISTHCLNLNEMYSRMSFVYEGKYSVSNSIFNQWNLNISSQAIKIISSAAWLNGELEYLESNTLDSFSIKTHIPSGYKFKTHAIDLQGVLRINFKATAKLYVEEAENLVTGDALRQIAETITNKYSIDGTGTTINIPVEGFMDVNIVGTRYDDIVDGNYNG